MIKNSFIEGMKFAFGFFLISGILAMFVYAAGWHTAGEILGGTFLGNYIFNGTVDFKGDMTAGNLISDNITLSPAKTRTIYFDPSMTAQEIQDIIDNVSKHIPYGRVITFQFLDGTYNLNQTLYFSGFYGGGSFYIFGNRSEIDADILHTNQQVFLDFSSENINGIVTKDNEARVYIYNLKVKVNADTNWNAAIKSTINSKYVQMKYNYLLGTSTNFGIGIYHTSGGASAYLRQNYFSNVGRGIECSLALCYSLLNDDFGTMPAYGLYSQAAGKIGKYSTQPAGSTANEFTTNGGQII